MNLKFDVAIVGAGFSGIACAIALVRRNPALNILLLDPASELPAGLPFAGARPEHLLNVRADQMSVDSSRPLDFCRYLTDQSGESSCAIGDVFAPRLVYCDYVRQVFQAAQSDAVAGKGLIKSMRVQVAEITSVDQHYLISGTQISEKSDEADDAGLVVQMQAVHVILALGAGKYKSEIVHPRWHLGPWRLSSLPMHNAGDTALIIGTGLTGIDSAQTLHRLGWLGSINMLSRNARLPAANLDCALPTWHLAPNFVQLSQSPRLFLRALRLELTHANRLGVDWRAVLNALRSITQEIYAQWAPSQRVSILRRAGSLWGAHRHRMPPSVAALIKRLQSSGQLALVQGRFVSVLARSETALSLQVAGGAPNDFALVIDARGPNYRTQDWPLLPAMIDKGLIKASRTGFGLAVDQDGRVGAQLYSIGVLTYGERLETMAVPEIRKQAERIAQLIAP